ncbi:type IV secretion system protein, partial [Pseudomonas aeruginosa]
MIDGVSNAARLVEFVQTTAHWAKELAEMKRQYDQLVRQVENTSGIRHMADLVNNPALRSYLPDEYQDMLKEGGSVAGEIG